MTLTGAHGFTAGSGTKREPSGSHGHSQGKGGRNETHGSNPNFNIYKRKYIRGAIRDDTSTRRRRDRDTTRSRGRGDERRTSEATSCPRAGCSPAGGGVPLTRPHRRFLKPLPGLKLLCRGAPGRGLVASSGRLFTIYSMYTCIYIESHPQSSQKHRSDRIQTKDVGRK